MEIAVFGGGCFWCMEAVYAELKGVAGVMPGYAGGTAPNPTYEAVSTGITGHAEVARVTFDPAVISYDDLLTVFFATHDPTTLNRQGDDVGPQYRSIILYTNDAQRKKAKAFIAKLNESGSRVVTEVKKLEMFYEAEDYHRRYYEKNKNKPYCESVISPKLALVKDRFYSLLKQGK